MPRLISDSSRYLKTRVLTSVLGSLLIVILLGVLVLRNAHQEIVDTEIRQKLSSVQNIHSLVIKEETRQLTALLEVIANDDVVKTLLVAKDHEAILDKYLELYSRLNSQFQITHFYFSDSQRINIARVHNPPRYGDTINRFTTLQAKEQGRVFSGIELGKYAQLTLRVVKPVFEDGRIIGYLELGKEIESVIETIKQVLSVDLAISIYKKYLDKDAWLEGMKLLSRPAQWQAFPEIVVVGSTINLGSPAYNMLTRHFLGSEEENYQEHFALHKHFEENQLVVFSPLYNVRGDEIGDLVTFIDFDHLDEALNDKVVSIWFVGLIIFLVLSALIYWILDSVQRSMILYRQSLEKKSLELEQANLSLEDKVRDRTSELEIAMKRAEQANVEKSRFLDNMSHELRTPMHSILSFSALALKYASDEKVQRFIQNIRTSGVRLTGLLDDLLDLSNFDSSNIKLSLLEQNMMLLLEQAISRVNEDLQHRELTVKFNCEGNFDCLVDQKRMTQVVVNLLNNAIKYSNVGGVIYVELSHYERPVNGIKRQFMKIGIIDQGIGIPAEELEQVFERFVESSKTRTDAGGIGLGLPIAKEIVELHKGRIWAESPAPDQQSGAGFYIELPMLHSETQVNFLTSLDDVIKYHHEWEKSLDNVFLGTVETNDVSVSLVSDENLCSIGQWINNQDTDDETLALLKKAHEKYHQMAGEYVAYQASGNPVKAAELKKQLSVQSGKVNELFQSLDHFFD